MKEMNESPEMAERERRGCRCSVATVGCQSVCALSLLLLSWAD